MSDWTWPAHSTPDDTSRSYPCAPPLGSAGNPYAVGEEVARRLLKNAGEPERAFEDYETIKVDGSHFTVYKRPA